MAYNGLHQEDDYVDNELLSGCAGHATVLVDPQGGMEKNNCLIWYHVVRVVFSSHKGGITCARPTSSAFDIPQTRRSDALKLDQLVNMELGPLVVCIKNARSSMTGRKGRTKNDLDSPHEAAERRLHKWHLLTPG